MKSEDIYRTILVRMWGDEKFNRLSPIQPSGKSLWIYLLTGPFSNQIGLFRAGEMTLAEELGWDLKAFRECFRECFEEGLIETSEEYFKDRLIFIPNFLKINFPQNPNVVKSWTKIWNSIPECQLKLKVWNHIKIIMESKDKETKAWSKAFIESCRKPSIKTSRKPFDNPLGNLSPNQEQEQEQEQEKDFNNTHPPKKKSAKTCEPFELPNDIPPFEWESWMEVRKKIGATNTSHAKELLINKLRSISEKKGISIKGIIELAIMRGWRGIEEGWIKSEDSPPQGKPYRCPDYEKADKVCYHDPENGKPDPRVTHPEYKIKPRCDWGDGRDMTTGHPKLVF